MAKVGLLKPSIKNINDLVIEGNFELVKELIYLDINLIDSVDDTYGRTPLMVCADKKSHFEIAKYLLDSGCDVNIQSNFKWNNWTALMAACFYGNTMVVELLVNANASLDLLDVTGCTALQLALENGHVDCIQVILNEKESNSIEMRLKLEKNLQDAVLINNDYELARKCLSQISSENIKQVINSTTSGSHTLLYKACRNGNPEMVKLLLENGAIARPHYYTKYSPLYIACHMGNFLIAKMVLEKFPHLIDVPTIENFLPFHAVCSQGHMDILKMLIDYRPYPGVSYFEKVFNDQQDRSYLNSFDLNEKDMNGHTGLHAAVLANHSVVCSYLLGLQFTQISDEKIAKLVEKLSAEEPEEKSPKSVPEENNDSSVQVSLFDHFKNVFLDPKSYDPYVINYTAAASNEDDSPGSVSSYIYNSLMPPVEPSIEVSQSTPDRAADTEKTEMKVEETVEAEVVKFCPLGVNTYSKFGRTCMHDAIRNCNVDLVKMLIEAGGDPNAPVYDVNFSAPNPVNMSSLPVLSNCLAEAIRTRDEIVFLVLLNNFKYDEDNFRIAYSLCQDLWRAEEVIHKITDNGDKLNTGFFSFKKIIPYLLRFKVVVDLEYKLQSKSLVFGMKSGTNQENGLILNWSRLEPPLITCYESWLFEVSKHFKQGLKSSKSSFSMRKLKNKQYFASTFNFEASKNSTDPEPEPIQQLNRLNFSSKKLHLYVITRLDLSSNELSSVPFTIFQIESLKFLRLSSNQLQKLPTGPNNLDDITKRRTKEKSNRCLPWNCHSLEEIYLDKNQLTKLPFQLFQIKSLKHLSVSNNQLKSLPEEIWTAPMLVELNASFNRIQCLPLVSKQAIEQNCFETPSTSPENTRNNATGLPLVKRNNQSMFKSRSRKSDSSHILTGITTPTETDPLHVTPDQSNDQICDQQQQTFLDQNSKLNRQLQISYEERAVDKANFWWQYSALDTKANNFDELFNDNNNQIDHRSQDKQVNTENEGKLKRLMLNKPRESGCRTGRESLLKELNLANNLFEKMPECLSCMAPKLVKLNLSFNRLESMGAISDLPKSLKFLDLSNNLIKFSMRLLNEKLLLTMINYFERFCTSSASDRDYRELLDKFTSQTQILLEHEFCYSGLVAALTDSIQSGEATTQQNTLLNKQSTNFNLLSTPRRDNRNRQKSPVNKPTVANITNKISNNINNFSANRRRARSQSRSHRHVLNIAKMSPGIPAGQAQIPFDIFLLNLKNIQCTVGNVNFDRKFADPESAERVPITSQYDLESKEKRILNNLNIQIFMEHLCPHKRHIKLENLKSLNLSHNKLKRSKLMFDLTAIEEHSSIPQSTSQLASLLLAEAEVSQKKRDQNMSTVSKKLQEASMSSESDLSFSEAEDSDIELKKGKEKQAKVKSKRDKTTKKSSIFVNNKEERSKMTAKLMYPNLTHLDLSFNLLRHLTYKLMYLENLSYLNVSSNDFLSRVSPRLGLLTKLWNFDLKKCDNIKYPSDLYSLIKQQTKTVEVLSYLKSIMEQSKVYARVKLMFVGVQAIGKTSLLNRMKEEGTAPVSASWTERTSKTASTSTSSHIKPNISTVGIDINEWVYDKSKHKPLLSANQTILHLQQQSIYLYQIDYLSNRTLGAVTFKTWDFGGQKEYYSTHQYFISKRALYLVVWKLSEEEKGITEIQNWLTNIQTRAPGSPVIIVGTHQDQLAKHKNYKEISSYLQRVIYERFVRPTGENETTSPYPPIMASVEISSKTGYNIKMLAKIIYETASQMKAPGFKDQSLLEQKIPHTYLALEECISYITKKFKHRGQNPVLSTVNYLKEIRLAIEEIYPMSSQESLQCRSILIRFRDDAEILQATQFLHENGILMHYNDSALRDLFFLDPQWLCDVLATVITIREVNPFAAGKGIMKINDLQILFKGSRFSETDEIMRFIVDLLGKFELALTWDNEHLLIPSLLPSEALLPFSTTKDSIRIEILSKEKAISKLFDTFSSENPHILSDLYQKKLTTAQQLVASASCVSFFDATKQNSTIPVSQSQFLMDKKMDQMFNCTAECSEKNITGGLRYYDSVTRLYCLSYLPQGFFARLIARILSDQLLKKALVDLVELDYSMVPENLANKKSDLLGLLVDFVCQKAEWKCWQTGIELKYLGFTLLSIKELLCDPLGSSLTDVPDNQNIYATNPVVFKDCESELQLKASHKKCSFIECYCAFKNITVQAQNDNPLLRVLCNRKVSLKLFATIIEIIDSLLEDWYPDLGTKFMQDSKGEYLVTRLTPCTDCLIAAEQNLAMNFKSGVLAHDAEDINYEMIRREIADMSHVQETESGLGRQYLDNSTLQKKLQNADYIFALMIDDVCYAVMKQDSVLSCPKHGEQLARMIAPDLAFEDIDDHLIISHKILTIEGLLGRGSFGFVYGGYLDLKHGSGKEIVKPNKSISFENYNKIKVAIKVLESKSSNSSQMDETAEPPSQDLSKLASASVRLNANLADHWNHRKSIQMAAKAYTVARQEIAILGGLQHENIVGMLGMSVRPLAIILELAPMGNLKEILEQYKKHLAKVSPFIIQQVAIQISSAFVYLHSNRIIYRDLKCENVLVWKFPMPQDNLVKQNITHLSNMQLNSVNSVPNRFFNINSVYLKLADYSISRSVLPTGTKGFAGTEGFMAPEIVRFNGEETYSEKVDCFSFGMLLYELISLKLPFEGHEQIKDIILNDARPLIKTQDCFYPTLMLDLMCLCWLDNPCERPTAVEINTYSKSYEFSHLLDVTVLEDYDEPPLVVYCLNKEQECMENIEVQAIQKIKDERQSDRSSREMGSMLGEDNEFTEDEEFEEEDVIDMWVVRNSQNEDSSQIEILSYEHDLNCTNKKIINVCPGKIEMLCVYNENQVWCVDSSKCLYIYCAMTKRKLNQYLLDVKFSSTVISMFAIEAIRRILLCTSHGGILLLNVEAAHEISLSNNSINNDTVFDDGLEYILIEIPIKINTSMILQSRYEKNFDLWIGSENSEIFCFSLKSMKLTGSYIHTSSHHFVTNSIFTLAPNSKLAAKINLPPINKTDPLNVTILKTNPNDTFFLWSYVYPGSTIFLWNHVSKKIMSAYNCLRAFEDLNFQPIGAIRNFRVVDISFMNGHLYCGINNGIILAMKRLTLTPLFMFNAHISQLNAICPLTFDTKLVSYNHYNSQDTDHNYTDSNVHISRYPRNEVSINKTVKKTTHSLVSLGRALAPVHEDVYLSSANYRDRVDSLKKYANCLILCSWNCTES